MPARRTDAPQHAAIQGVQTRNDTAESFLLLMPCRSSRDAAVVACGRAWAADESVDRGASRDDRDVGIGGAGQLREEGGVARGAELEEACIEGGRQERTQTRWAEVML